MCVYVHIHLCVYMYKYIFIYYIEFPNPCHGLNSECLRLTEGSPPINNTNIFPLPRPFLGLSSVGVFRLCTLLVSLSPSLRLPSPLIKVRPELGFEVPLLTEESFVSWG